MSTVGSNALYTPELLALAVSLADYPLDPALTLTADARSRTCGSSLRFGCALDDGGSLERIGVQVSACAVGQAAAAVFVAAAVGRSRAEIAVARDTLASWLAGAGERPDWPGVGVLERTRDYPARHAAIMLAWDAALAALSNPEAQR